MATINMESILGKARNYMWSEEGVKRQGKAMVESGVAAAEARSYASEAGHVLRAFIEGSARSMLPAGVASVVAGAFYVTEPYDDPYNEKNTTAIAYVHVQSNPVSSPSLAPARYGGVEDLIGLYYHGVGHTMNRVWGDWHGDRVGSRVNIPYTPFIDDAVNQVWGYANGLHIIDIEILDV